MSRRRSDDGGAERMAERVRSWSEAWSSAHLEGQISAANLVLAAGELEAARLIHAELCRRFPSRVGVPGFLDLDKRLAEEYGKQRAGTTKDARTRKKRTNDAT